MNHTEPEYRRRRNPSQTDRLQAYLEAHPGEWIEMPVLAQVITPTGIGAAVHSRISDLRRRGLHIQQVNSFETRDGVGVCCSRYRYVPAPISS